MIAGENLAVLHLSGIDVPKMQALLAITPLHLEHLIEVAVENFALPTDVNGVAAHQALNRAWIKGVIQQRHVVGQLVVVL